MLKLLQCHKYATGTFRRFPRCNGMSEIRLHFRHLLRRAKLRDVSTASILHCAPDRSTTYFMLWDWDVRWSASTPPSMGLRASTRAGKQAHLLPPLPVGLYMLEMRRALRRQVLRQRLPFPRRRSLLISALADPTGLRMSIWSTVAGCLKMRCGLSRHFCNENIVASHDTQKDNQTILH